MALSLQEQLLKAGLVSSKQVKNTNKAKSKQQKMVRKGQAELDNSLHEQVIARQTAKIEQDKKLNSEQQKKLEKKAIKAQIKQLITSAKLPKLTGDDYYNFVDHKKIKRIVVNDVIREKLANGNLAIVQFSGGYEIVPREVAVKIAERSEHAVVVLNDKTAENTDDPYAKYKIPDDLMW